MPNIRNSLTDFLDTKLITQDDVDQFLDDLEDEVLGYNNRDFYLRYKGDIKELVEGDTQKKDSINYESELLQALLVYAKQREKTQK